MKKLLLVVTIAFVSCQPEQKDITGHWTVLKQIDQGTEVQSSSIGVTFNADGTLEYDWKQEPSFLIPTTYYRLANDSLYWTTKQQTMDGEKLDSGRISVQWKEDHLILRRDKYNYTELERTVK